MPSVVSQAVTRISPAKKDVAFYHNSSQTLKREDKGSSMSW